MPTKQARLEKLAKTAKTITHLPLAEQFGILAAKGLGLTDINWRNWKQTPNPPPINSFIPLKSTAAVKQ